MRRILIAGVLTLLAVLWVGRGPRDPFHARRAPDPGHVARPLDLDCRLSGANALACGQKFCEEGLIQRGLLSSNTIIDRWDSYGLDRPDHLRVTVYTAVFESAGGRQYRQCEMVGKAVMAARALAPGQVPQGLR